MTHFKTFNSKCESRDVQSLTSFVFLGCKLQEYVSVELLTVISGTEVQKHEKSSCTIAELHEIH